ncbi:MAG: type II toxin-antitoxin system HicB family antitoxin [Candidatus Cloacimonetes bacterium]|nr:type II toxin-antitoxin system HicB family antitoxin [Candidatus Cloacimonadota bacterium]
MEFKGTMRIEKGEVGYCSVCLENNVASQGKTIEEAIANLKEAIALYYEDGDNAEELEFIQKHEFFISRFDMTL